jgi:hypothetical protein
MHACPNKLTEGLGGIMPVSNAPLATVDVRRPAAELRAEVSLYSNCHFAKSLIKMVSPSDGVQLPRLLFLRWSQ